MGRRALQEKRTIIANEGLCLPQHHPPVQRAVVSPILYDGRAIGLMAVVNKPAPYTAADAELLEIIVAYLAPVIAARQARDHEEKARRDLEERLRQSEKMEALGRLAGGVAHDFNNLLTVINGYAQISLAGLPAGDPLADDLGEIRAAGERAADLTRQLLAFSRRQALERQPIDLNAVLRGMGNMLGRLIGEHIALELSLEAALWPVRADVSQMEQVVMNLAANARDAMPAGGRLTIATANLSLGQPHHLGMEAGDYVVLTLTDTGEGIPAAMRDHLFEPFYSTKGEQGTGLGLATVYGIVRQTAGHIEVDSEAGVGTTFTIYLPRARAGAPQAEMEQPATPLGRERVLLVEDQAPVRQMTARMLGQLGYAVTEADSAAAACERWSATAEPFDLLITDVLMPGTGGPELVARLRRERPGLPALYISGYPQDSGAHAAALDPPVRLLAKPFTVEELAAAVRRALDGRNTAGLAQS
jgi:signal transduction histidine kinase/CheY-like chemotaxis protein